jgi:hypothetical protein
VAKARGPAETKSEGVQGEPEVGRIDHRSIPVQGDDVVGDGDPRGSECRSELAVVAGGDKLATGSPSDQAARSRRSECGLEVSEVVPRPAAG